MSVAMIMAVMSVSERREADYVDQKSKDTDDEKFIETVQFVAFAKPVHSIKDDLNAD